MLFETCRVPTWNCPAREKCSRGPGRPHVRKPRRQFLDCLFSEPAIGGYLAAKYREHRRVSLILVETQYIITGDRGGIRRAVVIKRTHAGVLPHHFRDGHGACEVTA